MKVEISYPKKEDLILGSSIVRLYIGTELRRITTGNVKIVFRKDATDDNISITVVTTTKKFAPPTQIKVGKQIQNIFCGEKIQYLKDRIKVIF